MIVKLYACKTYILSYHRLMPLKVTDQGATPTPKLSKLIPETVTAQGASLDTGELLQEVEAEWQKDWSET
jgi:hypothetical protein